MGLGNLRRNAETLTCALRNHELPAATVARLRPEDAALGLELPDGRRLARCLRCDGWFPLPRPARPERDTLPPLEELRLPRRGKALRDAIVLRLIALDRAFHSVVFGLLATGLVVLAFKLPLLQREAQTLRDQLQAGLAATGQDPTRGTLTRELDRVRGLRGPSLTVLTITAVAYCIVEAAEAIGLWLEQRWAEYLTVVATAGLLPFEINELVKRVSVLRLGALVVNVAILVYLLWAKRLFGLRGGAKVDEELDREALRRPVLDPPGPQPVQAR